MIDFDIIPFQTHASEQIPPYARLAAAAIVYREHGEKPCVYVGARHGDILKFMAEDGLPRRSSTLDDQGFVCEGGYWYNREDSLIIAINAGQLKTERIPEITVLTSEDLWSVSGVPVVPDGYALWLDDKRPVPPGFEYHLGRRLKLVSFTTANQAIEFMRDHLIVKISLDHDLGNYEETGNGYDVAKYIESQAYQNNHPRIAWWVHSMNPVGKQNIIAALQRADQYWDADEANADSL